jgi:hypothetical protein
MAEIIDFAGILESVESSSKASCRFCTAEVRGSNPLGSTLGKCYLQVKLETKMGGPDS